MPLNIAIDGPSGAGKSTIAKHISKSLGIAYLDTGAMYRGCAYFSLQNGVSIDDTKNVLKILDKLQMDIVYENGSQKVVICGKDVTPYLREHEISMAASTISKIPEVRIKMVELQREIAKKTACVLDGRDIGSYVLPDADYKFYITATLEERAKRRQLELKEKGTVIEYQKVYDDMEARDKQDSSRSFAPLKIADGAIVIDTTNMNVNEVLDKITSIICK